MIQRLLSALAFTLALALGMPSLAQAAADAPASNEPTIQQIYEAANGGKMADAEAMVEKVLKTHPNSAKAHFVQAELLAAEGKLDGARNALARAKALSPDMSFAKPEAVERLTRKLDKPAAAQPRTEPARVNASSPAPQQPETRSGSAPWLPIALVALLAVGYLAFRRRVAPPSAQAPSYGPAPGTAGAVNASGAPAGYPSYGSGGNWTPGVPPAAAPGMGLGSALATGAAVGVGAIVAQEAVRHWMNDRSDSTSTGVSHVAGTGAVNDAGNAEMGRSLWPSSSQESDRIADTDFGITDTSSWDDGSSGGSDNDW